MNTLSFANIAIVSCGTLSLERQLLKRIDVAKEKSDKVIVVYGGKFCYVNADEPTLTMETIIQEQGAKVTRIQATHCMDALASEAEREQIPQEVAGLIKIISAVCGCTK